MVFIAAIVSLFVGFFAGFALAAVLAASGRQSEAEEGRSQMLTPPPQWVQDADLTMLWWGLSSSEREALYVYGLENSVTEDEEELEQLIQVIKNLYKPS